MADGKGIREELAELTGAVRELRDREVADTLRDLRAEVERLRAERATHHCTGCSCMHIHYYAQPYLVNPCAPSSPFPPYQVTCNAPGTYTSVSTLGVNPTTCFVSN